MFKLLAEARKMRSRPVEWWMGVALGANLFLAAVILLARGADVHGTEAALAATARIAFLWFWVAYTGGALTTLFGATFQPLKQHGRELGLAFAAALSVHLLLVAWLCLIGAAPALGVFMFFGPAAAVTLLLTLFSFGNLQGVLGLKGWQLLRIIGMNFILYAFLTDFVRNPLHDGVRRLVEYLPFTMMAIAAPLLRLAAWGVQLRIQRRPAWDARVDPPSDVKSFQRVCLRGLPHRPRRTCVEAPASVLSGWLDRLGIGTQRGSQR